MRSARCSTDTPDSAGKQALFAACHQAQVGCAPSRSPRVRHAPACVLMCTMMCACVCLHAWSMLSSVAPVGPLMRCCACTFQSDWIGFKPTGPLPHQNHRAGRHIGEFPPSHTSACCRSFDSIMEVMRTKSHCLPQPDVLISAVGTKVRVWGVRFCIFCAVHTWSMCGPCMCLRMPWHGAKCVSDFDCESYRNHISSRHPVLLKMLVVAGLHPRRFREVG